MNASECAQKNINKPIFDGTFFTVKKIDNGNVQAVCILCNNEKAVPKKNNPSFYRFLHK